MKIQPNLTPGDDMLRLNQLLDFLFSLIVVETRVGRMCADRGIDVLMPLAQLNCTLKRATVRITRPHIQNRSNASRPPPLNHLFAIDVKFFAVNVCMRVDKHYCLVCAFCALCAFLWLTSNVHRWGRL